MASIADKICCGRVLSLTKPSLLKIEIVFRITPTWKVIVPNKFGSKFLTCLLQFLCVTANITLQS